MVEVPLSGAPGSVVVVWERGGWRAKGRRGDPMLAIAGQAFPRLAELVWRAGHSLSVGLALTDDHLAQAWREVGLRPETGGPPSRYDVEPSGEGDHVTVGWDPPMGTYFAQVYASPSAERPLAWMGTTPAEMPTLVSFLRKARPWALIDDQTGVNLETDRRHRGARTFAS